MQRVLITGGAGVVGSHLAEDLPAHGYATGRRALAEWLEGQAAGDHVEHDAPELASRGLTR